MEPTEIDWAEYRRQQKAALAEDPLSDAMPSIPRATLGEDFHGPSISSDFFTAGMAQMELFDVPVYALDAGVPTDYMDPETGNAFAVPGREEQAIKLNLMTAEDRFKDKYGDRPLQELPEEIVEEAAELLGVPKADMVNLPEHYARFPIEPIRFIGENKLDWFQGNIVKYTLRHDAKNGIQDIDKTIRYAQMYRKYLSGDADWWRYGRPEDFKP